MAAVRRATLARQASLPLLGDFGAMEYVRMLDGLERLHLSPGQEWADEFFRVSAERIVRTSERVRARRRVAAATWTRLRAATMCTCLRAAICTRVLGAQLHACSRAA